MTGKRTFVNTNSLVTGKHMCRKQPYQRTRVAVSDNTNRMHFTARLASQNPNIRFKNGNVHIQIEIHGSWKAVHDIIDTKREVITAI